MGIHYGMRLKDLVVDFSGYLNPENIKCWLESSNDKQDAFNRHMGPNELDITQEIKFLPMVIYDYKNTFDFTDMSNVKIDMFICFKNAENDIAIFIMWLKSCGIKSGSIYYSDNVDDYKVDLAKRLECDMEPGPLSFYIPNVPEEDLTDEDKEILNSKDGDLCLGAS